MLDGVTLLLSLLSIAAIAVATWYAIFQLLPLLEKIVAGITGLPKIVKHLTDLVKLLILVSAAGMALNVLYIGSGNDKYLEFLKDGCAMAGSALSSMQWMVGIALWLFIGVSFVKTLSGKEVKDHE